MNAKLFSVKLASRSENMLSGSREFLLMEMNSGNVTVIVFVVEVFETGGGPRKVVMEHMLKSGKIKNPGHPPTPLTTF